MSDHSKKDWRVLSWVGGGMALILLMLYMGGFFTPNKIGPGDRLPMSGEAVIPEKAVLATVETITEYYEAVGTVRPKREANIESQVTAKVLEVRVRPGDRVVKGDVLIVLDSRESQARLGQAAEGLMSAKARRSQAARVVSAAEAAHDQASSAYRRVKGYFLSEAATSQDLEQAESAFVQAEAGMKRAKDGLTEADAGVNQAQKVVEQARIDLGYAEILATEEGEVVKRLTEPGDLARPGKTLVVVQTRDTLRLEALVREGLISRVSRGTPLQVVLTAQGKTLQGRVEEVVPSADPMTRTFLVKVGLPPAPELFPGMFGRLRVPVAERSVVLVPKEALSQIGQLEVVTVHEQGVWLRIFVKTGREIHGKVEILSGLKGGETLALRGGRDA
ncbi:MAG: efflux RND transporter periplasmic adaptor subunit [Desulfatiglandales bacterium]